MQEVRVRLSIRILGIDLLDVDLSTDAPSPAPDESTCGDIGVGFIIDTPPEPRRDEWDE